MAGYQDAKAGWEIYQRARYAISREELNRRLKSLGKRPISERTFRHYDKLRRFGYTRYIPINQLDIKTIKDPLWDRAVRSRYPLLPENVPVVLSAEWGGERIEIPAEVREISASAAICSVTDPDALELLKPNSARRRLRSRRIRVYFPHSGASPAAEIDSIGRPANRGGLHLSLSFASLVPLENLTSRDAMPASTVTFRFCPTGRHGSFAEWTRKSYWLFQAIEALRLMCDELLEELDAQGRYVVPSTELHSLKTYGAGPDSLVEAALHVGAPVAAFFQTLKESRVELQGGNSRSRKRLAAFVMDRCAPAMIDRMKSYVYSTGSAQIRLDLPPTSPRLRVLIENHLLKALEELFDDASGSVSYEVSDTPA